MKRITSMCALALLTTLSVARPAHASDENSHHGKDTYRFDFVCDYPTPTPSPSVSPSPSPSPSVSPSPAPSPSPSPSLLPLETYHADARVFAEVDSGDHVNLASLQANRDLNNYISISRDGQLIFADSAILYSDAREVIITGSNGVSPAIHVKRGELVDLNTAVPMCYDSWLQQGDRHGISGSCCVRARPIGDHLEGIPTPQ